MNDRFQVGHAGWSPDYNSNKPKKKRTAIASSDLFCIDIKLDKKEECDAQIIETLKELLPHFKKRGMGIDDVVWAILHSAEPDSQELWGYLDHFFAAYDWKDSQQNSKITGA